MKWYYWVLLVAVMAIVGYIAWTKINTISAPQQTEGPAISNRYSARDVISQVAGARNRPTVAVIAR